MQGNKRARKHSGAERKHVGALNDGRRVLDRPSSLAGPKASFLGPFMLQHCARLRCNNHEAERRNSCEYKFRLAVPNGAETDTGRGPEGRKGRGRRLGRGRGEGQSERAHYPFRVVTPWGIGKDMGVDIALLPWP